MRESETEGRLHWGRQIRDAVTMRPLERDLEKGRDSRSIERLKQKMVERGMKLDVDRVERDIEFIAAIGVIHNGIILNEPTGGIVENGVWNLMYRSFYDAAQSTGNNLDPQLAIESQQRLEQVINNLNGYLVGEESFPNFPLPVLPAPKGE